MSTFFGWCIARTQYIPEYVVFYKNKGSLWRFLWLCEELSGGYLEGEWLRRISGGYLQDIIVQVSWSFLEREILEFVLMID